MFSNHDLIDAVANRRFATLTHLEAVVDEEFNEPWFSTGKFGIVFKLTDPKNGQKFALKVFKERDAEKEERLRQIGEQIAAYPSFYWVSYDFLENEILVESRLGDSENACAILMEWIEGKTLGEYVKECCENYNQVALYKLAYTFDQMALWLLSNPFAHGDLKHDNIIIKSNGLPVLVDYDGMYFPIFAGQPSMELGTPDYQHPQRGINDFGSYLDDFSILVISLSLYSLSDKPNLFFQYNTGENILLMNNDFINPYDSPIFLEISTSPQTYILNRLWFLHHYLKIKKVFSGEIKILLGDDSHYKDYLSIILKSIEFIPYVKFFKNGDIKWGFCDKDKNILIDFKYDQVKLFSKGVAMVMKNKLYGYIDKFGSEIIPCVYEGISNLKEDTIIAKKEGLYGLIDREGITITKYIFSNIHTTSLNSNLLCARKNNKSGILDLIGNTIVPFEYEDVELLYLKKIEGKLKMLFGVRENNKYGIIDQDGVEVIPHMYDSIENFRNSGFAKVSKINDSKLRTEKFGFIDLSGKVIVPVDYYKVEYFFEDYSLVMKYKTVGFFRNWEKPKYYFYNTKGKKVLHCKYDGVKSFKNGISEVSKLINSEKSKYGIIDKYGKEICPCVYDSIDMYKFEKFIKVEKDKKYGFIDLLGKEVIQCVYDYASQFKNNYALVRTDGKYSIIDSLGKKMIDFENEIVSLNFENGLAITQKDNKYGIVDANDSVICPHKYDKIDRNNSSEVFVVKRNNKFGFLSKVGEELILCQYTNVFGCEFESKSEYSYFNGFAIVSKIVEPNKSFDLMDVLNDESAKYRRIEFIPPYYFYLDIEGREYYVEE